jgi:hypothetical protein
MNIEWEERPHCDRSGKTTWYAKIDKPSNLRQSKHDTTLTAAAYIQHEAGRYSTGFMRSITQHFNPPRDRLHTELGARRRIRKYLELWAIAGYPTGE